MSYKITVVSASWRPSCQILKSNLTEAKIIYHMIDADSEVGMEYCSQHGVRGLPTTIITDEAGEVVRKVVGLQPAKVFQEYASKEVEV